MNITKRYAMRNLNAYKLVLILCRDCPTPTYFSYLFTMHLTMSMRTCVELFRHVRSYNCL